MKLRQHDLSGRHAFRRVNVYGDPTTVVGHRDAVIDVDLDRDLVAEASQRFVDRVVDDLENEVVETAFSGIPDVHAGSLANGIEALKYFDRFSGVAGACERDAARTLVGCHRRGTPPIG